MDEHALQVVETLRTPDVGRAACARFVARFIRPQGVDVPSTPQLAMALEQLAARGRSAPAWMPVYLYPLRALLWLVGFIAVYRNPTRVGGFVRKQLSIVKKSVKNARKARAKARARGPGPAGDRPVEVTPDVNGATEPTRRVG
jgi:hypothetical protein